ncbi:MAG: dihydropteroate synthase [Sphingomonadales bacterium]|jgi:dihydropteroate synthase
MAEMIASGAAVYAMPVGLTDLCLNDKDATLPLAGGVCHFSAYRIIASQYGERVFEKIVPLETIETFLSGLSDEHQQRLQAQIVNSTSLRAPWHLSRERLVGFNAPKLMGILNVTPDSFSDGGKHLDISKAIAHGEVMAGNGAYIIDIGGESTRPGAKVVWEGDEIERVVPVIEALAGQGHIISVDTRKAAVMRAALDAGAAIVNDVSALGYDEEATDVVAESNCPVVLMHAQGDPATMQNNPSYDDALLDIFDWLESKIEKCEQAGIARDRIMIDPGIGFGKSVRHNLELTNGLSLFHALGCPVLFGASRKRFIGALAGVEEAEERLPGSLAAAQMALDRGAQVIRVHDVAESRQLLNIWQGARDASQMPPNL